MSEQIPGTFPEKLTHAGRYLSDRLEERGIPVLTQFEFFQIIADMYRSTERDKLYLRHDVPTKDDYTRLRSILKKNGMIGTDPDYGARIIRVLTVSDLPAEEIVCLVDSTIYVSHLSAMQRWGLTNRVPAALMLTRPNRTGVAARLCDYMDERLGKNEDNPFPLKIICHPEQVRHCPIRIHESKIVGASIQSRSSHMRISTIGQTFCDMLQRPDLCGGMNHVLDVWEEHAKTYLNAIVRTVDTAASSLIKSRAGHIIEERLGLSHPGIEPWRALGQRGGSRKLDPTKAFAPTFSDAWMISLNV